MVLRQNWVGLLLAAVLIATWLTLHVYAVFFLRLADGGLIAAPFAILILCWLNVGLFILAHDAMHGSLAPGFPRASRWIGTISLLLYAAFDFEKLRTSHLSHHSAPGTVDDPDFHAAAPRRLWPWYAAFMRRYFGWREFLRLCIPVTFYLLLGAKILNLLLMWALPAALSSLQLFAFGTFLPHRHDETPFADDHRARSNGYSQFVSLITCFHFGYHHEHHLMPHVPWWRLPAEHRRRAPAQSGPPPERLPRTLSGLPPGASRRP